MIVQLVLEPLWKAYEACEPGADVKGILSKMVKSLDLQQANMHSLTLAKSHYIAPLLDIILLSVSAPLGSPQNRALACRALDHPLIYFEFSDIKSHCLYLL